MPPPPPTFNLLTAEFNQSQLILGVGANRCYLRVILQGKLSLAFILSERMNTNYKGLCTLEYFSPHVLIIRVEVDVLFDVASHLISK